MSEKTPTWQLIPVDRETLAVNPEHGKIVARMAFGKADYATFEATAMSTAFDSFGNTVRKALHASKEFKAYRTLLTKMADVAHDRQSLTLKREEVELARKKALHVKNGPSGEQLAIELAQCGRELEAIDGRLKDLDAGERSLNEQVADARAAAEAELQLCAQRAVNDVHGRIKASLDAAHDYLGQQIATELDRVSTLTMALRFIVNSGFQRRALLGLLDENPAAPERHAAAA